MDNYNIEMLAPSELREYHNNPRNNDEAVEYVANSIKEFGFKIPIVVDKETQELMEDSALVIVDYNKAVKLGFVKLTENISVLAEEDHVDNDE